MVDLTLLQSTTVEGSDGSQVLFLNLLYKSVEMRFESVSDCVDWKKSLELWGDYAHGNMGRDSTLVKHAPNRQSIQDVKVKKGWVHKKWSNKKGTPSGFVFYYFSIDNHIF